MNELLCVQNYDCKNNFCFYENTSGFMFLQLKDTSNLIKVVLNNCIQQLKDVSTRFYKEINSSMCKEVNSSLISTHNSYSLSTRTKIKTFDFGLNEYNVCSYTTWTNIGCTSISSLTSSSKRLIQFSRQFYN